MSKATLAELHAVLHRPALRRYFTRAGVTPTAFMKEVRTQADLITPIASTIAIQDEHDRPFLDLSATNPQPLFFVTGMQTSRQVSTMESRSFPQQRLSDYSATRDH